jgi:uncharacterized protein (TIGR03084 family)
VADLGELLDDLTAEQAALESVVDPLGEQQLRSVTPAEGWNVLDQLAHLASVDDTAILAMREPDAFLTDLDRRRREGDDPVEEGIRHGRELTPDEVVRWWKGSRTELLAVASGRDPRERVPWYGPPMSMMSFITARVMETWAHGQDVRDAVGAPPEVSDRLRHVAHIGVGARPFSYAIRGLEPPTVPVDVVLDGPSGDEWRWGPGDAADRVTGPALDFCLVVTRRRHRDDVELVVEGDAADEWMSIAQAFAGPPGDGRRAGQFPG